MKQTLKLLSLLIACFFCVQNCLAQTSGLVIPQPGDNVLDTALNKFAGNWRWASGTDTVIFNLKKENMQVPILNFYQDYLVGTHLYKKGNIVVESSLQYKDESYNNNHLTILGGSQYDNRFIFFGSIYDLSKNKLILLTLTMNAAKNKLQLSLKERPGLRLNLTTPNVFTLPNNITLSKFIPIVNVE